MRILPTTCVLTGDAFSVDELLRRMRDGDAAAREAVCNELSRNAYLYATCSVRCRDCSGQRTCDISQGSCGS